MLSSTVAPPCGPWIVGRPGSAPRTRSFANSAGGGSGPQVTFSDEKPQPLPIPHRDLTSAHTDTYLPSAIGCYTTLPHGSRHGTVNSNSRPSLKDSKRVNTTTSSAVETDQYRMPRLDLVMVVLEFPQRAAIAGVALALAAFFVTPHLCLIFHRLCSVAIPLLAIMFLFYALTIFLHKVWTNTSIYLMFMSCVISELVLTKVLFDTSSPDVQEESNSEHLWSYLTYPLLTIGVLTSAGVSSLFSSLVSAHCAVVIITVSAARYISCSMLVDINPCSLRPLLGYFCGLVGVVAARYTESILLHSSVEYLSRVDEITTTGNVGMKTGARTSTGTPAAGRVAIVKRRRSSSVAPNNFTSHGIGRRISLPTLTHRSNSASLSQSSSDAGSSSSGRCLTGGVLDQTILHEADGILADVLADPSLPRHLAGGIRAVLSVLNTTVSIATTSAGGHHGASGHVCRSNKTGNSSYVSLSDSLLITEYADWPPYSDIQATYLPKRLRRSLPPSLPTHHFPLLSSMPWTTTTSATGMPTLETAGNPPNILSRRATMAGGTIGRGQSWSSEPKSRRTGCGATSDYDSGDSPPRIRGVAHGSDGVEETDTGIHVRVESGGDYCGADGGGRVRERTPPVARFNLGTLQAEIDQYVTPIPPYSGGGSVCHRSTSSHVSFAADSHVSGSPSPPASPLASDQNQGSRTNSVPGPRLDGVSSEDARDEEEEEEEGDDDDDGKSTEYINDEIQRSDLMSMENINQWHYPIFDLTAVAPDTVLSRLIYSTFTELGFIETFSIPVNRLINYFHALELGYRDKPYHNRSHAADVLHAVYYMTSQPIPGLFQVNPRSRSDALAGLEGDGERGENEGEEEQEGGLEGAARYGVMAANLPALELMALYAAAAMHDFEHPGRTNAFLVATFNPIAVLYNDRSVLESHHASAAWKLFLSDSRRYGWLEHLDSVEYKRFRYLTIEAILATDLKRHFELLAEFNAKVSAGIDWSSEADRLMVASIVIKMADINGPCKPKDLHLLWTERICEEFYEQGEEEVRLGLPMSPYMNRAQPQVAKLQESFITHLVAPLCNSLATAGLLPAFIVDPEDEEGDENADDSNNNSRSDDDDNEAEREADGCSERSGVNTVCVMLQNLIANQLMWTEIIQNGVSASVIEASESVTTAGEVVVQPHDMEPIREEDSTDSSTASSNQ